MVMGWDDIAYIAAGTVGSAALNQMMGQDKAKFENEQTLEMARQMPAAQMAGLRNAGLNPMLAVNKLDMPTSSASAVPYAPADVNSSVNAGTQRAAQQSTSALQAKQATTEGWRGAVAHNDAIKGNYALMQLAGTLDAAMTATGAANGTEALAKLEEPRIKAGLQELRAAFASAKNDTQVYEALNSKAVQLALDVLGRITGSGSAIAGAVDRYRARSQRGDIINLNKE